MAAGKAYMMSVAGLSALTASVLVSAPTVALAQADPVEFEVSGHASGVAGVSDGDAAADADAEIRVKGSTVLESGLEIGAVVEGRLDGQQPSQLFSGGRYSGLLVGGPRGIAPTDSDAFLQGAYAYARGGFGQVIVGRDHGVARTFAVKAPTLFRSFNVNDWRTDLTGLNDVHTVNDFSGYATKVSYLPPANLFGGAIGGLQLGVSYSPTLADCDNDECLRENRLLLTPQGVILDEEASFNDVIEAALYYQKEIKVSGSDGLLLGLGASFVTADEDAQIETPAFSDYEAYSLGLNLGYRGVTVGGSIRSTSTGISAVGDDNYLAFDAGLTFRTGEEGGDWGFTLGYGRSEADLIGPNLLNPTLFQDTQTAQAGVTYFLSPGVTVGAAAQFIEATRPEAAGGEAEAATFVIESAIRF